MVPKFAENGQERLIWSWDHWKQRAGGVKMVMARWKKRKSRSRSTRRSRRKTMGLKEKNEALLHAPLESD